MATTTEVVHMMTGSSTVRCGHPMRQGASNPDGWDLGTATTEAHRVTCPACLPRAAYVGLAHCETCGAPFHRSAPAGLRHVCDACT